MTLNLFLAFLFGVLVGFCGLGIKAVVKEKFSSAGKRPRPSKSRWDTSFLGTVSNAIRAIDEMHFMNSRLEITGGGARILIKPAENDHVQFRDIMRDVEARRTDLEKLVRATKGGDIALDLTYEKQGVPYTESAAVPVANFNNETETVQDAVIAVMEAADDLAVEILKRIPA